MPAAGNHALSNAKASGVQLSSGVKLCIDNDSDSDFNRFKMTLTNPDSSSSVGAVDICVTRSSAGWLGRLLNRFAKPQIDIGLIPRKGISAEIFRNMLKESGFPAKYETFHMPDKPNNRFLRQEFGEEHMAPSHVIFDAPVTGETLEIFLDALDKSGLISRVRLQSELLTTLIWDVMTQNKQIEESGNHAARLLQKPKEGGMDLSS